MERNTNNDKLLNALLADEKVRYTGLEKEIDWSVYSESELKDLIIKHPEQILMRLYIIDNGYFTQPDLITEIMKFYAGKRCDTFRHMIKEYGLLVEGDMIMVLFSERVSTKYDPYYLIHDLNTILERSKLSETAKDSARDLLNSFQESEKEGMLHIVVTIHVIKTKSLKFI